MMGTSGAPKRSIRPPRQRAKVPGWASFDAQQRGGVPEADVDPFPPFPPTSSSSNHLQRKPSQGSVMDKNYLKEKNDVSAVVGHENISFISPNSRGKPWKGFSQLIEKVAVGPEKLIDPYPNAILASTATLQGVTDDANQKKVAVEKLKALFGWADESLIEDVLVAVNYELEQASASLESMAVMTLPENSDPSDVSEAVENSLPDQSSEGSGPLLPESLGFENLHVTVSRGHMPTAPPEPEWEEKSKEEHLAADKLNAKAAANILQIRNEKHKDIWKLDLHGLHAAEAVQALELRLELRAPVVYY